MAAASSTALRAEASLSLGLGETTWTQSPQDCSWSTAPWRLAIQVVHVSVSCPIEHEPWGTLGVELSPELAWRQRAVGAEHLAPGLGAGLWTRIEASSAWSIHLAVYNKVTLGPSRATQDKVARPTFSAQLVQPWVDVFDTGVRVSAHWRRQGTAPWGLRFSAGETLPPVLRLTALGRKSQHLAWRYVATSVEAWNGSWAFDAGLGWGTLEFARIRAIFPFPWLGVSYTLQNSSVPK